MLACFDLAFVHTQSCKEKTYTRHRRPPKRGGVIHVPYQKFTSETVQLLVECIFGYIYILLMIKSKFIRRVTAVIILYHSVSCGKLQLFV